MTRVAVPISVVAVVLSLASASASASRPVALTAIPAHVTLAGTARGAVRVTNRGTKKVLVDVSRAGFALDWRGRPRIVRGRAARSAATWLTYRPRRFVLRPRSTVSLGVASKLPQHAEPGDHDALLLLTTRPLRRSRVAVRVRMGVVVVVRAPGRIVRRLALRRLRATRRGKQRTLDVVVLNSGNVTESLANARAVVTLPSRAQRVVTFRASARELRPRTSGIVEFRLAGSSHGLVTARIVIPAEGGRPAVSRIYRIRL